LIVDHTDLAQQAFDDAALPTPPRSVDLAFQYTLRLLAMLPAAEAAGYVRAPVGGENVVVLSNGTPVRAVRVMYADGQIYKVMNDAPNGGPQWVAEDVQPALYVPYEGPHTNPPEPPDPPASDLEARVLQLESNVRVLSEAVAMLSARKADKSRVEAINARLELVDAAAVKKPLPVYIGRAPFFGGTVRSRPEE
jgi:flagellar basal body rod protein FlgC